MASALVGATAFAKAAAETQGPAASYVPVVRPVLDDVSAGVSLAIGLFVFIGLCIAARLTWNEWRRDPLIIEPFDVPADLVALGLTGSVLSQQLYDALLDLQRSARPDDGHSDALFLELSRLQIDLQLPGTPWSVRSAIRFFKSSTRRPERRLLGEAIKRGRRNALHLRTSSGLFLEVPVQFCGAADLGPALRSAAESALLLIDPLQAAAVFQAEENPRKGFPRTLAALRFHLANMPAPQHQDAYVAWAALLRESGDVDGMEAMLARARLVPARRSRPGATGWLGPRYLNFSGSLHRDRREFDRAEQCFAKALVVDPENLAALFNLGLVDVDRGRHDSAERWFRRVIALNGRASRGYRGLGLVAMKRGDPVLALSFFDHAIDLAPRARWSMMNKIETLSQMGRHDLAEAYAATLTASAPNFAPQFRIRARLRREMGDPAQALNWAVKACESAPLDPWAWVERARAEVDLVRPDDALESAQRVIALSPRIPEGHRQAGLARALAGDVDGALRFLDAAIDTDEPIWAACDKARLLARQKRFRDAFALLGPASREVPDHAARWRTLATLQGESGDPRAAQESLRQAVASPSCDVWCWWDLSRLQRLQCDFRQALDSAEQAARPGFPAGVAWRLRGSVHQDLGRFEEAADCFGEGAAAQPGYVWPLIDLASLHQQQERFADALACCRAAFERNNQRAAVLRKWASILLDMGDAPAAADKLAQSLDWSPPSRENWTEVAKLLRRTHGLPDVIATLEKAVQRSPADPFAWCALANALNDLGKHDEGDAAFAKALALEPGTEALVNLRVVALSASSRVGERDRLVCRHLEEGSSAGVEWSRARNVPGRQEEPVVLFADSPARTGPRVLLTLARNRLDEADFDGAMQHAQAALAVEPLAGDARLVIAAIHRRRGQADEAIEALREAASAAGSAFDALLETADIELDRQRLVEAHQALDEALTRRPGSVRALRLRMHVLVKQKDVAGARQVLAQLCELLPAEVSDLVAWSRDAISAGGTANEAADALELAARRQPRSDVVLCALSRQCLSTDVGAALSHAREANETAATSEPWRLMPIALALTAAGAPKEALPLAERVEPLARQSAWLMYGVGVVFEANAQLARAVDCQRIAVSLKPADKWYADRLAQLTDKLAPPRP
jgi:tetratricopeptide (TPR) repeat protein